MESLNVSAFEFSIVFIVYSLLVYGLARYKARRVSEVDFYRAGKRSRWYMVAIGMIGSSLSGITYLSQPGWVADSHFTYMAMVAGYVVGYVVVAYGLLPIYYRLDLTTIYGYLRDRLGVRSYKTGVWFFILSRGIGAALRVYAVVYVLHQFFFPEVPIWLPSVVFMVCIVVYSIRGGMASIVWTDVLQTGFMLLGAIVVAWQVIVAINIPLGEVWQSISAHGYNQVYVGDWTNRHCFWKQFLSGIFIVIAMTGLDQDMMQKNLSCRTLKESQKNMLVFSGILTVVNLLFLLLGAVLYLYSEGEGISFGRSDELFAGISLMALGKWVGLIFIAGLIAAAYSSADGTLTALTTCFCVDILGMKGDRYTEEYKRKIRQWVHMGFGVGFVVVMLVFDALNQKNLMDGFFTISGYVYGPLLGMFAYAMLRGKPLRDWWVPYWAIACPVICYILEANSAQWFGGYKFGYELLVVNGGLMLLGLLVGGKGKKKSLSP